MDKSVTKDDSRVCRIPGSINTKTGTKCHITAVNGLVTLDYLESFFSTELNTYHRNEEDKHNKKKAIVKTIHVENGVSETFIPLAAKRCEAVYKWLSENNNNSVGYRNNLCFIFLNSFLQVVGLDYDAACEALRTLNESFVTPLSDREIKALAKSAFKNRYSSEKGSYEKYFRISNQKIMDLLGIDEDGMIHYGFSEKKRGLKKEQAEKRAIERAEKKANLEKLVVNYFFDERNRYTYKKIAEMAGTSERTVRRILKSKNLTRYDRKKQNVNEKSCKDSETEEKKVLILDEKKKNVIQKYHLDNVKFISEQQKKAGIAVDERFNLTDLNLAVRLNNNGFCLVARDDLSVISPEPVKENETKDKPVSKVIKLKEEIKKICLEIEKYCVETRTKEILACFFSDVCKIRKVDLLQEIKEKVQFLIDEKVIYAGEQKRLDIAKFYQRINKLIHILENNEIVTFLMKEKDNKPKSVSDVIVGGGVEADEKKTANVSDRIKSRHENDMLRNEFDKVKKYREFDLDFIEKFEKQFFKIRSFSKNKTIFYINNNLIYKIPSDDAKKMLKMISYEDIEKALSAIERGWYRMGVTGVFSSLFDAASFAQFYHLSEDMKCTRTEMNLYFEKEMARIQKFHAHKSDLPEEPVKKTRKGSFVKEPSAYGFFAG